MAVTREEEKINAANEYIHKRIYEENCGRTGDTFPAFIEGIEWADEHPQKGLVDIEKVCTFLHGVRLDYYAEHNDELINDLRKAIEE